MSRPLPLRDDDIRAQFDALRRVDAASVPSLDEMMDRPVVLHRRPAVMAFAAIVAAALIVLVARPSMLTMSPQLEVTIEPEAPSLLTWRSPTASLLRAAGTDLLGPSPPVTSSLLRGAIIDSPELLSIGR